MSEANPPRTISVSGTGKVAVTPDLADVRLGVTLTAKSVEAARTANATAMAAVLAALRELQIEQRDIQTTNLSLSPVYDYSGNASAPRLTGYTLTNAVAITIRELEVVGEAIDVALTAGATSLDSVAFRTSDTSAAESEARQAAIADALAKAEALAKAAGVSITGVAAISESGAAVPSPLFRGEMAKMAMVDTATPVEAGMNELSITVSVSYLID